VKRPAHLDPGYERYRLSYPKFPGVQTCVDLVSRPSVRGSCLDATEETLWSWAARGLHRLGTPDARQALWQARSRKFAEPAVAALFLRGLDEVKGCK
jgi:hypothetical protein